MRFRRVALVAVGASALVLGFAAVASAATVTIGSPLTASFSPVTFSNPATEANTSLAEAGAKLVSPVTGVIVRWRITQAAGGPFKLRVLVPAGGDTYAAAGTSSGETPTSAAQQTFATDLPIRAGQTIGIDNTNNSDAIGWADVTGSNYGYWIPQLADNSSPQGITPGLRSNKELGFNADVVPQPGVVSVTPASGPLAGGTGVVIRGHDFSGATEVIFGREHAGFRVDSDEQISAVSPSGTVGPVDVTVTTPGGTSPTAAADGFTYTLARCVVPKLKGKALAKARALSIAAHCALGKVTKPKHHHGKLVVTSQAPPAGTVLPNGATVSVKLGPKPHHKKRR